MRGRFVQVIVGEGEEVIEGVGVKVGLDVGLVAVTIFVINPLVGEGNDVFVETDVCKSRVGEVIIVFTAIVGVVTIRDPLIRVHAATMTVNTHKTKRRLELTKKRHIRNFVYSYLMKLIASRRRL